MDNADDLPVVDHEIMVLDEMVHLPDLQIVELGCGEAALSRKLVSMFPRSQVVGLEVDLLQHQKNLLHPQDGLTFVHAGAQSIPFDDATFDLAMMLKSLHHVPIPLMQQALKEAARVVKPGGYLYVSEPIYGGAFNDVLKLFHDEGLVRRAAQEALDEVQAASQVWTQVAERRFTTMSLFPDFEDFEKRLIRVTYADHSLDSTTLTKVKNAFDQHLTSEGVSFARPMHVRLFKRA